MWSSYAIARAPPPPPHGDVSSTAARCVERAHRTMPSNGSGLIIDAAPHATGLLRELVVVRGRRAAPESSGKSVEPFVVVVDAVRALRAVRARRDSRRSRRPGCGAKQPGSFGIVVLAVAVVVAAVAALRRTSDCLRCRRSSLRAAEVVREVDQSRRRRCPCRPSTAGFVGAVIRHSAAATATRPPRPGTTSEHRASERTSCASVAKCTSPRVKYRVTRRRRSTTCQRPGQLRLEKQELEVPALRERRQHRVVGSGAAGDRRRSGRG